MSDESCRASIVIAIGGHARLYHAFVTSAPGHLDAPATITLHGATLADIAVLADGEVAIDRADAHRRARLILVASTELAWQRARCRESRHLLTPADAGLVGAEALRNWLWRRLLGSFGSQDVRSS